MKRPIIAGLGLSIVSQVTALHGGPLEFAEGIGGKGLAVILTFPRRQNDDLT